MAKNIELEQLVINKLTQEQYDSIASKNPNEFYFITDAETNTGITKEEADETYLPLSGGTLTGDLLIDKEYNTGGNHLQMWQASTSYDSSTYGWSIGIDDYSNFVIRHASIFDPASKLPNYRDWLKISTTGYILPKTATHIGSSSTKFTDIYVKKINNGADIAVPTTGGTMVVATPPTDNGTYVLKATVVDGVVTTEWVLEA